MACIEELYEKDLRNLLTNISLIQVQYEVQLKTTAWKIKQLEDNEQEMRIKVEMGTERIKVLFMKKVVEAMEKG